MAAPGKRKKLASDTNLLFDLDGNKEFAVDFTDTFQNLGYSFVVSPTVVQELAFLATAPVGKGSLHTPEHRQLALTALSSLLDWGFIPFDLAPASHGVAEQFSRYLQSQGLLPDSECNDGYILAECALGEIPLLVTSDHHLLDIDEDRLRYCFDSRDLSPVAVASPRKLLKAVGA